MRIREPRRLDRDLAEQIAERFCTNPGDMPWLLSELATITAERDEFPSTPPPREGVAKRIASAIRSAKTE